MTNPSLLKKFLDKSINETKSLLLQNIKNTPLNGGNYTKDTSEKDLSEILAVNIIAEEISTTDFSGYFNNEIAKDKDAKDKEADLYLSDLYLCQIEKRVQEILSQLIKDGEVIKTQTSNDNFRLSILS